MSPAAPAPGRFELRGLVEGRVPPLPGSAERLRALERRAREAGFGLELAIDGGRFGFLARGGPRSFDPQAERPAEALEAWLRDLHGSLPEGERDELSSTLRAELLEDQQQSEILFALEPRRGLVCLERSGPARKPDPGAPRRRWSKRAQGLAIAGLAALFVLWQAFGPALPRGPLEPLGGLRSEELPGGAADPAAASAAPPPFELGADDFAGVLDLRAAGLEGRPARLWLELAPLLTGDRDAWLALPPDSLRRVELARTALIAGRAELRWFDASGRLVERRALPLEALWAGRPMRLSLPWPAGLPTRGLRLSLGL